MNTAEAIAETPNLTGSQYRGELVRIGRMPYQTAHHKEAYHRAMSALKRRFGLPGAANWHEDEADFYRQRQEVRAS